MIVKKEVYGRFLDGKEGIPLPVTFTWNSDDPLAIRLVFPQETQSINWVISRDFLHRGMTQSSGDLIGDVAAWPTDKTRMVLSLRPPSGRADIELPIYQIEQFLSATTNHTPIGSEGARIEAAIENFLDSIRERGA